MRFTRHGQRRMALMVFILAVAGCETASSVKRSGERVTGAARETRTATKTASRETRDGFREAVRQPVRDLNIEREEIPPLLAKLKTPYAPVPNVSCQRLAGMIKELDLVLGPDVDAPKQKGGGERAGEAVANATLGAVEGASSSIIPFRSLVRQATGASRYERRVRSAYQRGVARRSYLKGIGRGRGCRPPASPARS